MNYSIGNITAQKNGSSFNVPIADWNTSADLFTTAVYNFHNTAYIKVVSISTTTDTMQFQVGYGAGANVIGYIDKIICNETDKNGATIPWPTGEPNNQDPQNEGDLILFQHDISDPTLPVLGNIMSLGDTLIFPHLTIIRTGVNSSTAGYRITYPISDMNPTQAVLDVIDRYDELMFLKYGSALLLVTVSKNPGTNIAEWFNPIETHPQREVEIITGDLIDPKECYVLDMNYMALGTTPIPPTPPTPPTPTPSETGVITDSQNIITSGDMDTIRGGFENGDVAVLTPNNTPTYGADAGGCIITYVPTETEMTAFKQEVNNVSFWQSWLASNGLKDIIGCMILPFSVTGEYVSTGGIWIGGIHLDCNMHMTENSYRDIDFGTLDMSDIGSWGNFLDYEPYTVCTVHLPFIGRVPVSSSDVIGHTIGVLYRVNIVTGDFVAFITSDHGTHQVIRYEYYGNLASSVPLTQNDFTNTKRVLTAGLGLASSVAIAGLTGGAGAGAVLKSLGALGSKMGTGAILAEAGIGAGLGAFASNYCSRDGVKMQGNFSAQTSLLASRVCYVEIETVEQKIYPQHYREIIGMPSNATAVMNTLSGFNKISVIHLDGVPATNNELVELEEILKGGVVIK